MGYLDKSSEKWIYNDGSDNGNKLMSDGSIRAVGTARVWNDILGDIYSKKLSTTSGKVDTNWDENTITFQHNGSITNEGDRVQFNFQFPHSTYFGTGAVMHLHMHWEQDSSVAREITMKHRIQENGQPKNTTWVTSIVNIGDASGTDVFTYTGGTMNQISTIVDISIEGYKLSDIAQFQFARTDSNTGDLNATYIDGHVEIDSDGSVDEYLKDGI